MPKDDFNYNELIPTHLRKEWGLDPEIEQTLDQMKMPDLDEESYNAMQMAFDYENKYRKYLREKYVYNLLNPVYQTRLKHAKKAVNEIKDNHDRQLLIQEISKAAKLQEFAQRREYNKTGFVGRFGNNIAVNIKSLGEGGTRAIESFANLTLGSIGKDRSAEDYDFLDRIEAAKQAENPDVPRDNLVLRATSGASQMAPDLLAGSASGAVAGPTGMFAYWMGRSFPGLRQTYMQEGLSPFAATFAGAATAGVQSAIELISYDPFGFVKGLSGQIERQAIKSGTKGFLKKAVKKTGQYALEVTKEGPIEESLQAASEETGLQVASLLSEKVKKRPVTQIGTKGWEAGKQALAPVAIAGLAGMGGQILQGAEHLRNRKILDDVLMHDIKSQTPSRNTWKKVWGQPMEMGKNANDRLKLMRYMASEVRSLDMARSALEGETPTFEQGRMWEIPDEYNSTDEGRREYLLKIFQEGSQQEAGEIGKKQANIEFEQLRQEIDPEDQILLNEAKKTIQDISNKKAEPTPEEQDLLNKSIEDIQKISQKNPEQINQNPIPIEQYPVSEAADQFADKGNVQASEDGGLIRDETGNIAIKADQLVGSFRKGLKKTGKFLQKYFTTSGELKQGIFEAKVRRDGKLSAGANKIRYAIKQFDRAAKKAFGSSILNETQIDLLNGVLKGEIGLENIPEQIRKPLAKFRKQIDEASMRFIELGAIQGDLVGKFVEGLGTYIHRTYRIFTDPKWEEKIPDDVRNKAIELYRREYPDLSEDEIKNHIMRLLFEGKAADSMAKLYGSNKLGAKNLSILKKRGEIPQEIRDLYGEEKDPRINYARTLQAQTALIANHQFLQEIRDDGLGKYFSETPVENEVGQLKAKLAGAGSDAMFPLVDGKEIYTTPEIRDAFIQQKKNYPNWLRHYMRMNGIVKSMKTVWSAMANIRNFGSNPVMATMQGYWRVNKFKDVIKTTWHELAKTGSDTQREYIEDTYKYGILGESVIANEFKKYMDDIAKHDNINEVDKDMQNRMLRASKTKKIIKGIVQAGPEVYQMEDGFWKLYAWENEKADYRKARPDLSEEEIKQLTANIVRNVLPTYSMVPQFVKGLRHIPVKGSFVSFPSEILRTTYHTFKQMSSELIDPRTRKIGARRFAGTMTVATGASALAAFLRFAFGVSKREEEAQRSFVAPWQTNSILVQLGYQGDGVYRYIDLGYSDPYNYIRNPIKAMLRGENIGDGLWQGLKELASPFWENEILYQALNEASDNQKANGGQVWNPEASVDDQATDIGAHLWKAVQPGTFTNFMRIYRGLTGYKSTSGRSYNPVAETGALMSGQRVQELDVKQALYFRLREFKERKKNAERIFNSIILNRGHVSRADIVSAFHESEQSRKAIYKDLQKILTDAIVLHVTEDQMYDIAKSLKISGNDFDALYYGDYQPRQYNKNFIDYIYSANPQEAEERATILDNLPW